MRMHVPKALGVLAGLSSAAFLDAPVVNTFPVNPTVGQAVTWQGHTYLWDGSVWHDLSWQAPAVSVGSFNLVDNTLGVLLNDARGGAAATVYAGDSFTISIHGATPNQQVTSVTNSGAPVAMGVTDASGNWSASAAWGVGDVGSYQQTYQVGGHPAGSARFIVAVRPVGTSTTQPGVSYTPSSDDAFVFQSIAAAVPYTPSEIAFAKVLAQYGSPVHSVFTSQEVQQLWQMYVAAGYNAAPVVAAVNQAIHNGAGVAAGSSASSEGNTSLYIVAGLGLAAWMFSR